MKAKHDLLYLLLTLLLVSCNLAGASSNTGRLELAEFTENYVHVSIVLDTSEEGEVMLQATYTPTEQDAHLYSMELPKEGIDGLGRPTLLELPGDALMQQAGDLQESLPSEIEEVAANIPALPVYPAGAVTLTLPVLLPESGGDLVKDQVLITYMACTPRGCHKPVLSKVVDVQIPGK